MPVREMELLSAMLTENGLVGCDQSRKDALKPSATAGN